MRVPPPSTLKVRKPKSYAEANTIIGDQPNKVKRYDHEMVELDLRKHPITGEPLGDGELVVVLENKTTLGLDYTSDMSTLQRKGGPESTGRIKKQVDEQKGGYSPEALLEKNPNYLEIIDIYDKASREGRVTYLHSQTFLKQSGDTQVTIRNGSGIHLNIWHSRKVTIAPSVTSIL